MGARVDRKKDPDKDGEAFRKKTKSFPDLALEPDG
jgi:hypothetical protein